MDCSIEAERTEESCLCVCGGDAGYKISREGCDNTATKGGEKKVNLAREFKKIF